MRGLSFERLVAGFIEDQQARVHGKRRGIVTDVNAPENMGRIRARVPGVMQDGELPWALPCAPFTGPDVGFFAVPPVDAAVWIEFEAGDIRYPIWSGGWWPRGDAPDPEEGRQGEQVTTVIKTFSGMHIALDDDQETVVISDGSGASKMTLTSRDGRIEVKANSKVVVEAPQVELGDGARHPVVYGDDLVTYLNQLVTIFNSHVHPGETVLGIPVTPAPPVSPQTPPSPALLSRKVKTD